MEYAALIFLSFSLSVLVFYQIVRTAAIRRGLNSEYDCDFINIPNTFSNWKTLETHWIEYNANFTDQGWLERREKMGIHIEIEIEIQLTQMRDACRYIRKTTG